MEYYNKFHGECIKGVYADEVLRQYFPDKSYKGIFFDIGAFDPIHISNSYHFERNGWECFLFEANPELIPNLKKHRKNVFNYALYDEDKDSIEFNIVDTGNNWTASFSAIELSKEYEKNFHCNNKIFRKANVPQRKLDTIIQTEIPLLEKIDIMSIDIEGGELKMLKGFNLISKIPPKVIIIENVLNDIKIIDHLKRYNYSLDKTIAYNQYFVHS